MIDSHSFKIQAGSELINDHEWPAKILKAKQVKASSREPSGQLAISVALG